MKQVPLPQSLTSIYELLDAVQMSSAERDAAKDSLRRSDAMIGFALDAWSRMLRKTAYPATRIEPVRH